MSEKLEIEECFDELGVRRSRDTVNYFGYCTECESKMSIKKEMLTVNTGTALRP